MSNLKIQQKLGQEAFATLTSQMRSGGVHVVAGIKNQVVKSDNIIGKVKNVFNLGKKLDITLAAVIDPKAEYRFEKIDNVYYLVQQPQHQ